MEFRLLKANEIECRIAQISKNGNVMFLLYKDARVDMRILDEDVGSMNWRREHTRDNANCIVSIWDKKKNQWISKEDTGTESNTEAAKGLASDSFKRACFNWGIGRELYSAPTIWVKPLQGEDIKSLRLKCTAIGYDENRDINMLVLKDDNGNVRYQYGVSQQATTQQVDKRDAHSICCDRIMKAQKGAEIVAVLKETGVGKNEIYLKMAVGRLTAMINDAIEKCQSIDTLEKIKQSAFSYEILKEKTSENGEIFQKIQNKALELSIWKIKEK